MMKCELISHHSFFKERLCHHPQIVCDSHVCLQRAVLPGTSHVEVIPYFLWWRDGIICWAVLDVVKLRKACILWHTPKSTVRGSHGFHSLCGVFRKFVCMSPCPVRRCHIFVMKDCTGVSKRANTEAHEFVGRAFSVHLWLSASDIHLTPTAAVGEVQLQLWHFNHARANHSH